MTKKKTQTTVSELTERGYRVFTKHRRVYVEDTQNLEFFMEHMCERKGNKLDLEEYEKILLSFSEAEDFGFSRPSPRGGSTEVEVYDEDGNLLGKGSSVCSPCENFSRKLGRQIALGRALKDMEIFTHSSPLEFLGSE